MLNILNPLTYFLSVPGAESGVVLGYLNSSIKVTLKILCVFRNIKLLTIIYFSLSLIEILNG